MVQVTIRELNGHSGGVDDDDRVGALTHCDGP